MVRVLILSFVSGWLITAPSAFAGELKINETIRHYSITGKSAPGFAHSMTKNGPYSFQHRRRAWATASRDMTYQLIRERTSQGCFVRDAKVELKIVYTLPKLRNQRRLASTERKKWRRMYALLEQHERVHGRLYKKFARKARRALLKMQPKRTCFGLDRAARRIVDRLSDEDNRANDLFDLNDNRNYGRMARLYTLRAN